MLAHALDHRIRNALRIIKENGIGAASHLV
jgi:hypothetical protein